MENSAILRELKRGSPKTSDRIPTTRKSRRRRAVPPSHKRWAVGQRFPEWPASAFDPCGHSEGQKRCSIATRIVGPRMNRVQLALTPFEQETRLSCRHSRIRPSKTALANLRTRRKRLWSNSARGRRATLRSSRNAKQLGCDAKRLKLRRWLRRMQQMTQRGRWLRLPLAKLTERLRATLATRRGRIVNRATLRCALPIQSSHSIGFRVCRKAASLTAASNSDFSAWPLESAQGAHSSRRGRSPIPKLR